MISLPLLISSAVVLITFIFAALQDWKTRTVYKVTWYPAAVIGGICAVLFWAEFIHIDGALLVLFISVIFAGLCALFSILGMFGKADAKALILLSLTVPVTPFAAYIFPSLAVSALVNAGILSVAVPLFCLG
ncbi:MAG: prepilin peptidase, partial [Methanocorpusculum sp.]|nr:prepilin peptidase [Methanocorpusculum sp.]